MKKETTNPDFRKLQHDFANTTQNIRNMLMKIMNNKIEGIVVNSRGSEVLEALSRQVRNLKRLQKSMLSETKTECFTIELVSLLKEYCKQNTGDIIISLDEPGIDVYVDFVLLDFKRIIDNLVNNAKDILVYENIKNPFIYIRILLNNNTYATIEIEDNGPGISDTVDIFEKGFTTKSGEHKGMGLSIVKELLEKNNSDIQIKSKGNSGAIFSFKIKLNNKLR